MLVEGIDYLFDRYAFLKISPDADLETIKEAIKTKRSQNHPDRHVHVSEEAKQIAEKNLSLTLMCEEVLCNTERRRHYNEVLADFRKNRPDVISIDGNPIDSPNYTRIDLHDMVGEMPNVDEYEKYLATLVGFSWDKVMLLERVYRSDPTDKIARSAYQDILVNGIAHYKGMEDGAWKQAGVRIGKKDHSWHVHLDEISEEPDRHIDSIVQKLPQRIAQHVGLLGAGLTQPLLLPEAGGATVSDTTKHSETALDAHIAQATQVAIENLKSRSNRVKQLAQKRQELSKKLLDTLEIFTLSPKELITDEQRICLMRQPEPEKPPVCIISFRMNIPKNEMYDDSSLNGKTLDQIRKLSGQQTTIGIETHDEIDDWPMYATYVQDKIRNTRKIG